MAAVSASDEDLVWASESDIPPASLRVTKVEGPTVLSAPPSGLNRTDGSLWLTV